tara:strand:+ start:415 stop:891 length:477 start_codon:yes stop_codon:yes gene_type:complete
MSVKDKLKKTLGLTARQKLISQEEELYIYEQIGNELDNDIKDEGLWIKALSLSEGNEDKTKAKYIQLMIEKIKLEDKARQELLDNYYERVKKEELKDEKLQNLEKKDKEKKIEEKNEDEQKAEGNEIGYEEVSWKGFDLILISMLLFPFLIIILITIV